MFNGVVGADLLFIALSSNYPEPQRLSRSFSSLESRHEGTGTHCRTTRSRHLCAMPLGAKPKNTSATSSFLYNAKRPSEQPIEGPEGLNLRFSWWLPIGLQCLAC